MQTLGRAEPVTSPGATLGEGPRWDATAERLLWVDIEGRAVHALDPRSGEDRSVDCGAKAAALAPWEGDTVLVALADALAAVDLARGTVRRLVEIPHPEPGLRCNDGNCDPAGRFWIGTMAEDEHPGAGALYRFDGDGRLHTVLTDVSMSNGIGWSPDGARMFYIDSPSRQVDVFEFDAAAGELGERRPFAPIPDGDGTPDGLVVDDEGCVWVALFGGGEVRRFDPDGRPVARVAVPADHVTAAWFGDPDGRRLFITTATKDLSPEQAAAQPQAGAVFAFDAPVSGPPARRFAGGPP